LESFVRADFAFTTATESPQKNGATHTPRLKQKLYGDFIFGLARFG
jgi:hypothetical protein